MHTNSSEGNKKKQIMMQDDASCCWEGEGIMRLQQHRVPDLFSIYNRENLYKHHCAISSTPKKIQRKLIKGNKCSVIQEYGSWAEGGVIKVMDI